MDDLIIEAPDINENFNEDNEINVDTFAPRRIVLKFKISKHVSNISEEDENNIP